MGQFVQTTTSAGEFVRFEPVFFCLRAQISAKQRKPQPVLLMTVHAWEHISNPTVTHAGAFGNDHTELLREDLPNICTMITSTGVAYEPIDSHWVAVWKFPADLKRLVGFIPILGLPLPVGNYRFLDDAWWSGSVRATSSPNIVLLDTTSSAPSHVSRKPCPSSGRCCAARP